jgi:hypothetical protein
MLSSSARRACEPRPDWSSRYPPHPPNAGPAGIGSEQMNANDKSGARSHRSRVARRAPILQSRSRSPLRVTHGANLLRTGRQPRPPAGLRLPDRRLDPNSGRRLTKRRRQSRGWRRGSVNDRRRGRRRRGRADRRGRKMRRGRWCGHRRCGHAHRCGSRTRRGRGERRWRRGVNRRRRNRSARRRDRRLSCDIGLRHRVACWRCRRRRLPSLNRRGCWSGERFGCCR